VFEALHPNENRLVTHSEYIQYALDNNFQKANDALGARCPVCQRRMKVRAGKKKSDGHFYHNDDLFCPSKDPASRPYLNLPPTNPDILASQQNRVYVVNNLNNLWGRVKQIVPYLDLKEFIDILAEAKRLNVYGYAGLDPKLLPYVYVTLINFLPAKSYKKIRKLKFCFFYESNIDKHEDL